MSLQTDLTAEEIAQLMESGRRTGDKIIELLGPGWENRIDRDEMVAKAVSEMMGEMGAEVFASLPEYMVELLATNGNTLAVHHLTRMRQKRLEEALDE